MKPVRIKDIEMEIKAIRSKIKLLTEKLKPNTLSTSSLCENTIIQARITELKKQIIIHEECITNRRLVIARKKL